MRLPSKLTDCRPKELAKWVYLTTSGINLESLLDKLNFKVEVLTIFSNLSKDEIRQLPINIVNDGFEHMMNVLSTIVEPEPKGIVTIEDKEYVFDTDFKNITTGQIVDIKMIEDIFTSPELVVATLYIEKGLSYNQTGKKKVINPVENRVKLFKDHFPGDEFLSVFAFFLDYSKKRKNAIYALQMAQMTVMSEMAQKKKSRKRMMSGITGQR